jgi:hypothetical protein
VSDLSVPPNARRNHLEERKRTASAAAIRSSSGSLMQCSVSLALAGRLSRPDRGESFERVSWLLLAHVHLGLELEAVAFRTARPAIGVHHRGVGRDQSHLGNSTHMGASS